MSGAKPPRDDAQRRAWMRGLALLAWVSWEVVAWSALGTLAGYFLGKALGGALWIAALTGMLGLAIAFWRIYKASQAMDRDS